MMNSCLAMKMRNPLSTLLPQVLAGLVCVLASWPAFGEVRTTTWRDGTGEWTDAARWSAETALRTILDQAGVTLPRRDATDARIVNDVRQRTGRIIDRTPDSH